MKKNIRNDLGLRMDEARLNITFAGRNGDLLDPVPFYATDAELKLWAAEAIRGGSVPGVVADRPIDLDALAVDRFAATDRTPYNRIFVRPITPFG